MDSKPTCFIIGDQAIAVGCGEILRKTGFQVKGVISSGASLRSWAQKVTPVGRKPGPAAYAWLAEEPFDYLFSVFNVHVLPASVLALPRHGAINYHDALLPRYAGLHAPSWAILNREQEHGITWHLMCEEVDAGDILKQRRFALSSGDAALQVNQRCFDVALLAFEELAAELCRNAERRVPQDLQHRTYFSADQRPEAACVINWQKNAEEIVALIRALDFGPFRNPLGLPKIAFGADSFFLRHQSEERSLVGRRPSRNHFSRRRRWNCRGNGLVSAGVLRMVDPDGRICFPTGGTGSFRFAGRPDPAESWFSPCRRHREFQSNGVCRHEKFWSERLKGLSAHSSSTARLSQFPLSLPWELPSEIAPWLETRVGKLDPGGNYCRRLGHLLGAHAPRGDS